MDNPFRARNFRKLEDINGTEESVEREIKDLEKMNKLESPAEPEYAKILREYGGLESNVPINHPYWKIRP